MIVPTLEMLKRSCGVLVQAASGAKGPINGALVLLFANNINPTVDTLIGDLTEATFDGYAQSTAVVWAAAHKEPSSYVNTGDLKTFTCTGNTVQETVYGYALISTDTPAVLLAAELFDTPVQVAGAGDVVLVLPQYGQAPQS